MKFIICYSNRDDLNENKHLEILKEEMEGEIFKLLIDRGFKKEFQIDDYSIDFEIRLCGSVLEIKHTRMEM